MGGVGDDGVAVAELPRHRAHCMPATQPFTDNHLQSLTVDVKSIGMYKSMRRFTACLSCLLPQCSREQTGSLFSLSISLYYCAVCSAIQPVKAASQVCSIKSVVSCPITLARKVIKSVIFLRLFPL